MPKFCKDTIFIQTLVGEELDRLVTEGVIEKIGHSDWASPMVVVRRKDPHLR